MITYTVFNQSTVVTTQQLQSMVKAINMLLTSVCNDWALAPIQLVIGTGRNYPNNYILMLDYTDSDGALGYHDEINGKAYAKVFAKTILNYGGVVLYRDSSTFTVAQCLAHEMLEMIGNNSVDRWAMDANSVLWAMELCDAVESNLLIYTIPGGTRVALSDYVLPRWFDTEAVGGVFNRANTLHAPFTVDSGGYSIIINITDGYIDTVYGSTHTTGTASLISITAKDIEKDFTELKNKYKLKSKS